MSRLHLFRWPKTVGAKAGLAACVSITAAAVVYVAALWFTSRALAEAWKRSEEFGFVNSLEAVFAQAPSDLNMAGPLEGAARSAAEFMNCEMCKVAEGECTTFLEGPAFPVATDVLRGDAGYEAALAEADRKPAYFSANAPPFESGDVVWQRGKFLRVEEAIVTRLMGQGRFEEAARRLLRLARLTRRLEAGEPCLVGLLINHVAHIKIIDQLNALLRRSPRFPPSLYDDIEDEFAQCESILHLLPRVGHAEKLSYVARHAEVSPLGRWLLLRPLAQNEQAYALGVIHRWMATADKPYAEAAPILDALTSELKAKRSTWFGRQCYPTADMLLVQIEQARQPCDRLLAMARCLRIVNTWARRGDFNVELDRLNLPAACLVDPHDGGRLRVKPTADGPVIYSVGPDLKDDGGTLMPPLDLGLGPPAKAATQ